MYIYNVYVCIYMYTCTYIYIYAYIMRMCTHIPYICMHAWRNTERYVSEYRCINVHICNYSHVYRYAKRSPGSTLSRRGRYCAQSFSMFSLISSAFIPLAFAASMALSTRMRSSANCSNSCSEISSCPARVVLLFTRSSVSP